MEVKELFGSIDFFLFEIYSESDFPPVNLQLFAAEDERSPHPPDGRFDWGHPSEKGNKKWFEVLTNHVEENKLW